MKNNPAALAAAQSVAGVDERPLYLPLRTAWEAKEISSKLTNTASSPARPWTPDDQTALEANHYDEARINREKLRRNPQPFNLVK